MLTRQASPQQVAVEPNGDAIPISRQHLHALDGIRFIAAFSVLLGHGYWYVVLQQTHSGPPGPISLLMLSLPGVGMTLFFVLSGFVIHFNYHKTVAAGWGGTFDFFIARFSRLYPLFLAVFAIDFFHLLWLQGYFNGKPRLDFDVFGPLPFFLSFTQAWVFIPFNGHALYEHYGSLTGQAQATGAMWSLSTEFLFYATYPWLSGWLARQYGARLAMLATLVTAAALTYCVWGSYNIAALQSFGLKLFGTPSLAQAFQTWATFYSPVERMLEFLLGALAAQHYLSRSEPSAARWPTTTTTAVGAGIAAWIVLSSITGTPLRAFNASCAAAAMAYFVLLAGEHPTWISQLLARPFVVKCGEASYSLYLLHWYTMHQWAAPYAIPYSKGGRLTIFAIGVLISIALARVVYLLLERPALRWLRLNFKPLRLHITLGVAFVVITFFSIMASLQVQTVMRSHALSESASHQAASLP